MNNTNGKFGDFGGIYLPPKIKKILDKVADKYFKIQKTKKFQNQLSQLYKTYANRPSLLYFAERLSNEMECRVYLKREDLNHTGAHKINNVIGQGLLAQVLGKKKLIAETGAGQHGVATAAIAAYLNLDCDIYMGQRDIENQKPNVYRMKLLGARVVPVNKGQATLKDAIDVALSNYIQEADNSFYLLGSAVGPHPYPTMVRNFQKIIGQEIHSQIIKLESKLPSAIIACVGGGSNALGAFYHFIDKPKTKLIAVEPAGKGQNSKKHGLSLAKGKHDTLHGFHSLVLKNKNNEVAESYSAASGLDYPAVSPELCMLKKKGRLILGNASDEEAVQAFVKLSRTEGIIPALESAHALAYLFNNKDQFKSNDVVVVNLSGRGDKDVENVYENYL